MRTALPNLQKGKGRMHKGLEWQQAERSAKKPLSTKPAAPPYLYVPDRYSRQIRIRREWDEKMEHLNEK